MSAAFASLGPVAVVLSGAILALLALRAAWVMRAERGARRGSPPGTGHHRIDASYVSGGGGGGHHSSFSVPRDPQEYARAFVPRARREGAPDQRRSRT